MIISRNFFYVYLILLILVSLSTTAENLPLTINSNIFQIDQVKKLVLVNRQTDHTVLTDQLVLDGQTYSVLNAGDPIESGVPYSISRNNVDYTLYFTDLPLISIYVSDINDINRSNEIPGHIYLSDHEHGLYFSTMAIRIRGASSSNFPKKSYRVQLKDHNGSNKHESILGLRSDRRWLMLAMYNEPLRNNNKFSHDLWLDMHTPYYNDREPEALSSIRTVYTEAFLNGEYRGIYLFTEDADQKQFKLKSKSQGGELYKGETRGRNNTFIRDYHAGGMHNDYPAIASINDELWGGWELRHPSSTDWTNLYDFTDFVIDSDREEFRDNIQNYLRIDNAIDYFIFINVLRATDNTSKNALLGKYQEGEPYFFGVWDLDGVLGIAWNGLQDAVTTGVLTNNLFSRLLDTDAQHFRWRISNRWRDLRQGLLKTTTFKARYWHNYELLLTQGAYDREELVRESDATLSPWTDGLLNFSQMQVDYVNNWIDQRFMYLDDYFNSMYESALPVTLQSFSVSKVESGVGVEWIVDSASDLSHFTVERSPDGRGNWTAIGDVLFANEQSRYVLHDPDPISGNNYYRLKCADIDGSLTYSTIRSVELKKTSEAQRIIAYPNPAKSLLKFKTTDSGGRNFTSMSLYSPYGTLLYSQVAASDGSFDIERVPSGVYIAALEMENGEIGYKKIVVEN
jgi:hypothetical protein